MTTAAEARSIRISCALAVEEAELQLYGAKNEAVTSYTSRDRKQKRAPYVPPMRPMFPLPLTDTTGGIGNNQPDMRDLKQC